MKPGIFALFLYAVTTVEATIPTCTSTAVGFPPVSDECFKHEVLIITNDPKNEFPPVLVGAVLKGNEILAPKIAQTAFNSGCQLLCIYEELDRTAKSVRITSTKNVKSQALTLLVPAQKMNALPISPMKSFDDNIRNAGPRSELTFGKIDRVPLYWPRFDEASPRRDFQISRYHDPLEDSTLQPKISINAQFLTTQGSTLIYEYENEDNDHKQVLVGLFRKYDKVNEKDVFDMVDEDLVQVVGV